MKKLQVKVVNWYPMGDGWDGLIALPVDSGEEIKHYRNSHGEIDKCSLCGREIDCGWRSTLGRKYCLDCVDDA